MNLLAYILAKSDFGWIQIVVIAIIFGLSILGSIYQKAKEKKEQEDKARGNSKPSDRRQTQAPAPPAVPQATQPRQAPDEQTVRVSEELRLRQQRQAQLKRDSQKRLVTRTSPESDTNAIEARLVSIHPDQTDTAPMQISKVGVILQLDTPANAQRAIILHEIFSPPKALRKGGEMWDT